MSELLSPWGYSLGLCTLLTVVGRTDIMVRRLLTAHVPRGVINLLSDPES